MGPDPKCIELAKLYLTDFDYPTDEAKALAISKLAHALEDAANEWITDNCNF